MTTTLETVAPINLSFKTENTDIDDSSNVFYFATGPFFIYNIWLGLLVLIWIISGFLAFLASFVCLFYNSSIGDKMAGLILALFAGPFYWLFYIYNSNYCKSYTSY